MNPNRQSVETSPKNELSCESISSPANSITGSVSEGSDSNSLGSESPEAGSMSSKQTSPSSFISPTLAAWKWEIVESLMAEFKSLLDQNLEARSRAPSTESSNDPPRLPTSGQAVFSSGESRREETSVSGMKAMSENAEVKMVASWMAQDLKSYRFRAHVGNLLVHTIVETLISTGSIDLVLALVGSPSTA